MLQETGWLDKSMTKLSITKVGQEMYHPPGNQNYNTYLYSSGSRYVLCSISSDQIKVLFWPWPEHGGLAPFTQGAHH